MAVILWYTNICFSFSQHSLSWHWFPFITTFPFIIRQEPGGNHPGLDGGSLITSHYLLPSNEGLCRHCTNPCVHVLTSPSPFIRFLRTLDISSVYVAHHIAVGSSVTWRALNKGERWAELRCVNKSFVPLSYFNEVFLSKHWRFKSIIQITMAVVSLSMCAWMKKMF